MGVYTSGTLDLTNNTLVNTNNTLVNLGSLATLQAQINTVYGGNGAWVNAGAISTTGVSGQGLGVDTAGSLNLTNFAGQPVAPTGGLVKYTWMGDADFNGVVNFSDYLKLQAGYKPDQTWANGDFHYDGSVNFSDFLLLQAAYGRPDLGSSLIVSAIPEPATLGLLALGGLALIRRGRGR